MPRFYTSLLSTDYFQFDSFPCDGKNWSAGLAKWPKGQPFSAASYGKKLIEGKEIVIDAATEARAHHAFRMILQAGELWRGSFSIIGSASISGDFSLTTQDYRREQLRSGARLSPSSWDDIPWACIIAAKASRSSSMSIALAKWRISSELCSLPIADRDPRRPPLPKSPFMDDQTRLAYSIVASYSMIEELGLHMKASQSRPSTINGAWNPDVKQDLEARLVKAGVDLNETIAWDIRGSKTTLEKCRPKQIYQGAKKASWSRFSVRDIEVSIVDAIAHASWLRSCVSSHTLKSKLPLVRGLSPYESANIQDLGRRLFLSKLGLWKNHPRLRRIK